MAGYVLSPEQWRELSQDGRSPLRRSHSRIFYENQSATPDAAWKNSGSPAALKLPVAIKEDNESEEAESPYVVQRRSPGQRSQDSGFSGCSDSSEGSSNNSPVPNAVGEAQLVHYGTPTGVLARKLSSVELERKRSPLSASGVAERERHSGVLETDLDASLGRSPNARHVSRVYIRSGSPEVNLNLLDVLCEKNIQAVNLTQTSPEKSINDKTISTIIFASNTLRTENDVEDVNNDSTEALLEHKSIAKPSTTWKKLGESLKKVLSASRLSSSNIQKANPANNVNFTKESKSSLTSSQVQLVQCPEEARPQTPESPATSHYVSGPRSSTPRKVLKSSAECRTKRQWNRPNEQPVLRVHWADSYCSDDNADTVTRNGHETLKDSRTGTETSQWDSETPSMNIGAHASSRAAVVHDVPKTETRRTRRGLRMGVGEWLGHHTVDSSIQRKPEGVTDISYHSSLPRRRNHFGNIQVPTSGLRWSPVDAWLKDLPMFYQPESTCALQNKAISQGEGSLMSGHETCHQDLSHVSDDDTVTYAATLRAQAEVRRLQRRAHVISTQFAQLCDYIEHYDEENLLVLLPNFLGHVVQFVREAESGTRETVDPQNEMDIEDLINSLRGTCAVLIQLVTFKHSLECYDNQLDLHAIPIDWSEARQVTASLGQIFVSIVDKFVGRETDVLIAALEKGTCTSSARLAATSLTSLGSDAARPALKPLIIALKNPRLRDIRPEILRALSTLCSSADLIQDFERHGGLTTLFEILCATDCELTDKSEAAGVLAQITSPWLDPPEGEDGPTTWPQLNLGPYLPGLIKSLTELARKTDCAETLLLSTAALANLTFSHPEAIELMAEHHVTAALVQASKSHEEMSVFIQDQVATILANMAAVHCVRAEVVAGGGLVSLLCFLQLRPSTLQRPAEISACERVQKKSAIALSRLCGDEATALQVVQLHGVQRIAQLVREPRERNHSDSVLVACLATLHKMATACGAAVLSEHGAQDLIENRLLDVFLEYSSRPESYV